jgi:hypothetical protein
MQPGDLLLFRVLPSAPAWDKLIGWGERMLKQSNAAKKNYYHVAFVSPDTKKMWSAQPLTLNLYDIPDPLPPYIEVYRTIDPLTPDQLTKIFEYAESVKGTWYNWVGVGTAGYVQLGHFLYCSQFTWIAYSKPGVYLCPFEFLESPDDIALSPLIKFITSGETPLISAA